MFKDHSIFLLDLTRNLYKKPIAKIPLFSSMNFDGLMNSALRNNMLYFAVTGILSEQGVYNNDIQKSLEKIKQLCEAEIIKIKFTVKALEESLGDYVTFKTCKGFSRIPDDLDVYTRDFDHALNRLRSALTLLEYDERTREAVFGSEGTWKIHLHSRVTWANAFFVDNDLLMFNPRKAMLHGEMVTVPNNEAELLINMAHLNFEKLSFDITDLLHIYRLAGQVNWSTIEQQTTKYHWKKTFQRTARLLDKVHRVVYGTPSPFEDVNESGYNEDLFTSEFPASLPRSHIMRSFAERGTISYMLGKVLHSYSRLTWVILTGRMYEAQGKIPAELEIYRKGSTLINGTTNLKV